MMQTGKLKEITGKVVKGWYEWLDGSQAGCCSFAFESDRRSRYCVCMGFHDAGGRREIAWKIGRQSLDSVMQCDFDIDFEMPYDEETGDVDDTLRLVEFPETATMKEWNAIASEMRKAARRVWKDWRDVR